MVLKGSIILNNILSVKPPIQGRYLLLDVKNGTEVAVHLEDREYTKDELLRLYELETIFYRT